MSYDVILQRFRGGEAADVTSDEVWALLEEAWKSPPDQFHYCRVERNGDGGDLYAVHPGGTIDSLMFSRAEHVPPDLGPFLVREEQRADLPAELAPRAIVVSSGEELVRAVESG